MPSWIRVDTNLSREQRLVRARRILGVDRPTMLGHFVLLESELAERHPSGELGGLPVEALADWAGWEGELEPFSRAIELLTDEVTGKLFGWEESQGQRLAYLEREAERKRKSRKGKKGGGAGDDDRTSSARPADVTPDDDRTSSARPALTDTDTDTSTETTEILSEREISGGSELQKRASDARAREEPAAASPARDEQDLARSPLAHANSGKSENGDARSHDTFALPPAARGLLEKCYGGSKVPGRYAAVRRQLLKTLTPEGAPFEGDERVRAVDATHLDAACTAVLGGKLKKPDAAIRLVLLKLRDTYAERAAAIEALKATESHGRRGGARSIGQVLQHAPPETSPREERLERARAWGKEHPRRAHVILARLKREQPGFSDRTLAEFALAEFANAMEADEKAAAAGTAPTPERPVESPAGG